MRRAPRENSSGARAVAERNSRRTSSRALAEEIVIPLAPDGPWIDRGRRRNRGDRRRRWPAARAAADQLVAVRRWDHPSFTRSTFEPAGCAAAAPDGWPATPRTIVADTARPDSDSRCDAWRQRTKQDRE